MKDSLHYKLLVLLLVLCMYPGCEDTKEYTIEPGESISVNVDASVSCPIDSVAYVCDLKAKDYDKQSFEIEIENCVASLYIVSGEATIKAVEDAEPGEYTITFEFSYGCKNEIEDTHYWSVSSTTLRVIII